MSKKKVAKQLGLTAAVAASAVVAANPASAASASQVETAVVQAEKDAIALGKFYRSTNLEVSADFSAAFNKAKKSIESAKAQVATLTGSQKSLLSARVAAADANRLKAAYYIDAVKFVKGDLAEATAALAEHVEAGEITDETVEVYNNLSATIRKAERVIGKVYGSEVREALQSSYLLDAKFAREAVIYEVSQYELMGEIADQVAAGELEKAADNFKVLERLKVRAVEIKEAGRALYPDRTDVYPDLPAIESQLRSAEMTVVASYEEKVAPVVKSVNAVNAKTIEVEFSAAIDAKTLTNAAKNDVITLVTGEGAANAGTVSQKLSEDGKTLTLSATNFFKGEYTVKVPFETVKGTNGKFLSPVNEKVTVADKTAPVVTEAKATVKDTKDKVTSITLTFDEDVKSIDNVKIAGANYTPVVSGNTATVAVNLDATKSYDVTVVNAEDAAGNIKDVQSAPLTVSVDSNAPSVTSVEATGENTVKVTLDKALAGNTLAITGKVGTFNANVVSSAVVNPKNNKEYTVTLNSAYLFKGSNSDTVTLTVAKEALVDTLGNKNSAAITNTVTVSKDTVAPAVANVENTVKDGKVTGFTVTFTEEVTSLDSSKVAVVNAKGEILSLGNVATANISSEDAKKVVFTFVNGLKADKYGFDFAEGLVVDKSLAKNKSAKYSTEVEVVDPTKPVETTFNIVSAGATDNVVTVDFGVKVKATGTGSALNAAAYQVNGTTLPSDTKVSFVKNNDGSVDQTKVVIELPKGFVTSSDTKAIFRVNGVQSLENQTSNSFISEIAVTDNAAPVATSFVATDLTKLTVTYSEAIAAIANTESISDEIQLFDSKGASVAINSFEVSQGKLVLTVTDASTVAKLTTVATTDIDVTDAALNAQKAGVTINK
ncbi:hypothetical protein [Metabacillus halosaccharovorans]|uniref:hypothetical protein n=1 Tax=Metabacillus halosaccharovorans TaxID=930124 RepID=UPI00099568E9|nr:hypothetical protein [Metabacillus halosaccharovorans]